jgi:hypothetical protein
VWRATADNRLFAIKQVSIENNEPRQEYWEYTTLVPASQWSGGHEID